MKKLVLLVTILALCVPSYSAVLVYNVSDAFKPLIDFADAGLLSGDLVNPTKVDSFVVFDINTTTFAVNAPDVNNSPTAVVVFKKAKQYMVLGGADPNSSVTIGNQVSDDTIASFNVTGGRKPGTASLLSIDIVDNDTSLAIRNEMFGKNTSSDIGNGVKLDLAKSLQGQDQISVAAKFLQGFGVVKVTINPRFTKLANTTSLSVEQTVAAITASLKNSSQTQALPDNVN